MAFSDRFLLSGNSEMKEFDKITPGFEENSKQRRINSLMKEIKRLLQGVTGIDADVTRFLHVFGIRGRSIGIRELGT